MKIGELAEHTGCSIDTIRYYEKAGLLSTAPRSASNYRHYSATHVDELRFIRNCRALDMTHEEIRTLQASRAAPEQSCASVNDLIDEHLEHIAQRIALLQQFAGSWDSMTAAQASSLAHQSFDLQRERIERRERYFHRFSEALGPVQAARFMQVDSQITTLLDFEIARNTPLIQAQAAETP